jgi:hypothetical protein
MPKLTQRWTQAVFAAGLAFWAMSAHADAVTDAIQDALEHYKGGRLSAAVESLDFAAGLVRQRKAEAMKALLPRPLKGWEVDDASSTLLAAAFYGGGVSVQRVFRQGKKVVLVSYVTDSALLQSAVMVFSDPAFATVNGGRFDKVNGERALVKYDGKDQSGEIAVVINKRILVSIRGTQVAQPDLYAFSKLVDFAGLGRLP